MKVLITGSSGYVGVHLTKLLKDQGHYVVGCDLNLFAGCEWGEGTPPHEFWQQDVRTITSDQLKGFDCICHLAALSNDPMGDINPELTYSINRDGSIQLAQRAKEAGIPRFLFASSCAIYGRGSEKRLDENARLNPITAYARSKIETEKALGELSDGTFCPTYLRCSTAYGASPMLRIDLVVNNLLACAHARGDICIHSDGTPWRPFLHCYDMAQAFAAMMSAPTDAICNLPVNIGRNSENYQVRDVAGIVQELVPNAEIVFTGEAGADPRDYQVDFGRFEELFPTFRWQYTLHKGMNELHTQYSQHEFSTEDFEGNRYVRLRWLANEQAEWLKSAAQPTQSELTTV